MLKSSNFAAATFLVVLLWTSLSSSPLLAETLEEETQRLLVKLREALYEEQETEILARLKAIGPEARVAIPSLLALVEKERFTFDVCDVLTSMGGESVGAMRQLLRHKDSMVQYWALSNVPDYRDDVAPLVPEVIRLARSDDEELRERALTTLGQLGSNATPDAIAALAALLRSKDGHQSARAAVALSQLGPRAASAISALHTTAVEHPNPYARCRAMTALLAVGANPMVLSAVLAKGMQDKASYGDVHPISVRETALKFALFAAPHAKVPADALFAEFKRSATRESPWKYDRAARLVAAYGVRKAIPQLKQDFERELRENQLRYWYFGDREIPRFYEATCLRVSAAAALSRLDPTHDEAREYLKQVLEDNQWTIVAPAGSKGALLLDPRLRAAEALGRLGPDAAVALPALHRAMRTGRREKVMLAEKAAWAIARIDPQDSDCLAALCQAHLVHPTLDWSPFYAQRAEDVAKSLGDRTTTLAPFIVDAILNESDGWTRRHHIDLLVQFGDQAVVRLVKRALEAIEKEDASWSFRNAYYALDTLGPRAQPATELLLERLQSKSQLVRAEAARLLGVIDGNPKSVVPALQRLLGDARVLVRVRAAQALGRFGREASIAVEALQRQSDAESAWLRAASKQAIIEIRKPPAERSSNEPVDR